MTTKNITEALEFKKNLHVAAFLNSGEFVFDPDSSVPEDVFMRSYSFFHPRDRKRLRGGGISAERFLRWCNGDLNPVSYALPPPCTPQQFQQELVKHNCTWDVQHHVIRGINIALPNKEEFGG